MPSTTTINISLSDKLKKQIKKRARNKGYEKISEYVRELFRNDLEMSIKEENRTMLRLEDLLVSRLNSPTEEFDWSSIEAKHKSNLKKM